MIGGRVAARRLLAISVATIALQAVTFAARGESAATNRDPSILLFIHQLGWTLPVIFFVIGWLRWWIALVVPVVYIIYMRTVIWDQYGLPAAPGDALLVPLAAYSLVCLMALVGGAVLGRKWRADATLRRAAAIADGDATATRVPQRKLKRGLKDALVSGSTRSDYTLPFSQWAPVLAGAAAGMVLRLIFSDRHGDISSSMTASFIYFSPLVVGAVTVYVAETQKRRSWAYYIFAPFLANALYVAGTLMIMIEGVICAVIILPLFAVLGAAGGLFMGIVCRLTRWPRPVIYSLGVLPLVLGGMENGIALPDRIRTVEHRVTIAASPERVWHEIHNVRDIRPEEVNSAWLYRIGVPLPRTGVTEDTPDGRVRRITMGKNIHFDQVVTDWTENRYVRWTYRFEPDSFPPYALDEHVVIGGHYFDVQDTSYTLIPRGDATELTIRMQYRVSTRFNWYADPVASLLFANFEEVILDFYRRRSEAPSAGAEAAT